MSGRRRPVAVVITTFGAEFVAVAEHLGQKPRERRHSVHGGTIYEIGTFTGEFGPWTVAVAEIGTGNVAAAAEVVRATAEFAPEVILLVGVAGGVKDLDLGDVVAADCVYDYESGKDTDDRYLPRIKTHLSSNLLVQHARRVVRDERWQQRIRAPAARRPQAVVKPIAAGSRLVAGNFSATTELLQQTCSDAVAVEMEGFGFLRGAYVDPAADALVVRGVSDLLGGKHHAHDQQWQPAVARHAAAFAFAVLDSIGQGRRRCSGAGSRMEAFR